MIPFISLLPFMRRPEDARRLLERWHGGIELVTDGPNWHEQTDPAAEQRRFLSHPGPLGVHAPIFELDLATARHRMLREYSFAVYQSFIEWSAAAGATHMVLHTHQFASPIFLRDVSQRHARENVAKLGRIAQEHRVLLLVENIGFHDKMLFDQEEFVRLFDEIPTIKALLDVGHAHINGWDIPRVIQDLGEHLQAVHLHDNDGARDLHLPIGEGTIDWSEVWAALGRLRHPWRAILEYEVGTPAERLLEDAQRLPLLLAEQVSKSAW